MALIGFKRVNPREYSWEARDCVVRASSIAADIPYSEMHAKYKAAGRKDRRGTPVNLITEVLDFSLAYRAESRRSASTLNRFLSLYNTGRWVMCNRSHAWAVIDGVVHDDCEVGGRTKVLFAWRVK